MQGLLVTRIYGTWAVWSHLIVFLVVVVVVVFFQLLKTSLQLRKFFRRMLQLCYAVKVQKCFVVIQNFTWLSISRKVGKGYMMTEFLCFGWTVPLKAEEIHCHCSCLANCGGLTIDCRRYSCTDELICVLAAMVTLFWVIITFHPKAKS